MARIRTIKPEMAAHEGLFDLEKETGLPIRFAWCMLFTVADKEGRFMWRPRTLKAQVLPHDEVDFSRVLHAWLTRGFIQKYRVGNEWYGSIPTFRKHQVINNKESASSLPSVDKADEVFQSDSHASTTREARDEDATRTREVNTQGEGRKEGRGKEREGRKEQEEDPAAPFELCGETKGNLPDEDSAARRPGSDVEDLEPDDYLIWQSGLTYLGGEGKRALMGKLIKRYGREPVARKLAELMALPEPERPREPVSYLLGALKKFERRAVC